MVANVTNLTPDLWNPVIILAHWVVRYATYLFALFSTRQTE